MHVHLKKYLKKGVAWYRSLGRWAKLAIPTLTTALVAVLVLSLIFLSSPSGQTFAAGVYTSSSTDANGNTLLANNVVNDTQAYDTSQDSSDTTKQQLGIEPNMANGIGTKAGDLQFDGSNDYVDVSNPANGALAYGAGSFSYGAWVKPTANVGTWDTPLWKGGSSAGTAGFDIELGTGQWTASLSDGTSAKAANFFASSPALNTWYHLFVVVDRGTQTVRTYVNGVFANSTSLSGFGSVTSTNHLQIGVGLTGSQPYNGFIDDVRTYGRALSADEVAKLAAKQPISDANLAGWWKLDDLTGTTAVDSSPYANNGTLMNGTGNSPAADGTANGPLWASGADAVVGGFKGCGPEDVGCINPSGQVGAGNVSVTADSSTTSGNGYDLKMVNPPALTFDGSNDYVDLGNTTSGSPYDFSGTKNFSISAWVNPTVVNVNQGIVDRYNSGVAGEYQFFIAATGKFSFFRNFSPYTVASNKSIVANVWTFVSATYDGTNNCLYINGVLDKCSTVAGGSIGSAPTNLLIGAGMVSGAAASVFNGAISDVRMYSRALSAAEIAALNTAQPISNLGLVGWWKLNEATGTSPKDYSGNGNNGTLMNSAANSPAADGTTNGPIWSEGPSPVTNTGTSATSSSPSWQLPNYGYRNKVSVANASGATLPAGYSVNTPVTWGSLLNQNQSRADGNDFRTFIQPTDSVRSLNFTGTAQSVTIPASSSLATNNVTASMWINSASSTAFPRIFTHNGFTTGSPGFVIYENNGPNVTIRVDTSGLSPQPLACVLPKAINGKWNLITYTLDSGGAVKGYLNGVLTCSTTYTVGTGLSNTIAATMTGNDSSAQSLDDVRYYNSVLSASQIAAIYNGGTGTPNAVAPGLVGWWRLDEGSGQIVSDSSGNGNNGFLGTTSGSEAADPTWNSTAGNGTPDGVVSTAYEIPRYIPKASALTFDGSATKVAISNPAGDQVATPSGTISTWINRAATASANKTIYDLAGTGNNGAILYADSAAGTGITAGSIRFQYGTGSTTSTVDGPVPTNGSWYQVTVAWNSSGVRLYVNGALSASSNTVTSITVPSSSYLGAQGGSSNYFNGTIGETRLYNKALSAVDISQMYAKSSTNTVAPQANLLEAWRADEGTGATFNDASGVGANGTITIGSGAWLLNQAPTPSTQQAYFSTVAPIANSASSSDYYIYYGNPIEQNVAMSSPQVSRTGLSFNSATIDKVTLPTQTLAGDFTWSTWVQSTGSGYAVVGSLTDGSGYGFQLTVANSTNYVYTRFDNATASNQTSTGLSINTRDGAWHNVGVKYVSSTNTFTTFEDGTLGTPRVISGVAPTVFTASSFGFGPSGAFYYKGYLDDSRLYSRALSSTEISDLYTFGNTPPVSSSNLVGWWKFDEASGTSASDSSGNSNTGTLTNFAFNTTDGWIANTNLWQTTGVTTNITNQPAEPNTPRFFQWRNQSNNIPTNSAWSAELPITTGPTALGATGVKVVFNPEGVYPHNDIYHVYSWVVQAFSTGTEARGYRRTMPSKLSVVASSGGIDLIDSATNTLWMRLATNSGTSQIGSAVSKVAMQNGQLYFLNGGNKQLGVVDFANDNFRRYTGSGNSLGQETIANNTASSTYATAAGQSLDAATNFSNLAVQVLGTAPPKSFVALGGNNVQLLTNASSSAYQSVTAADSPIYKFARTSNDTYATVALASNGSLYGADTTAGGVDRWDGMASAAANVLGSSTAAYTTSSTPALRSNTVNALSVSAGTSSADYTSNTVAIGGPVGVDLVNEGSSPVINRYENTGSAGTSGWNSKGFGGALETNGSTNVTVPSSSKLDPGSGDFTVEGWFKTTASCGVGTVCLLAYRRFGGSANPGYLVGIRPTNQLYASFSTAGGEVPMTITSTTVNDGVWHHFALVRTTQTTETLYLDGVNGVSTTSATIAGSITNSEILYLGGSGVNKFTGQLDEVRISNTARYTANFTPQSTEFTTDANTMGLWHFNEPNGQYVSDSSGNANNGTLGANASVASDDPYLVSPSLDGAANVTATGLVQNSDNGTGLTFDGSTSYVNVPDSSSLHLTTAVTISGWFKPTNAYPSVDATTHYQNILSRAINGGGTSQVYNLDWRGTSSLSQLQIYVSDGTNSSFLTYTIGALTAGKWYNFSATWTPTAQAIYVNGARVASGTNSAVASIQAAAGTALRIGGYDFSSSSVGFLNGNLDDVRLYSQALNDGQVAALYNGGRGWNGLKETGLVGGWNFNEGNGTAAADYSGNGNNGTLTTTSTVKPTWNTGTPVRSQPALVVGTNDSISAGAVSIVSLVNNRQVKSYTTSNSVLPAYSVSSLSVGAGGLALIGTGGGAWNVGKAGVVEADMTTLGLSAALSTQLQKGVIRLKSGAIRL